MSNKNDYDWCGTRKLFSWSIFYTKRSTVFTRLEENKRSVKYTKQRNENCNKEKQNKTIKTGKYETVRK